MTTKEAVRWELPSLDGKKAARVEPATVDTPVPPEPDTSVDLTESSSLFDVVADQTSELDPPSAAGQAPDAVVSPIAADGNQDSAIETAHAEARDTGYAEGLEAGRLAGHAEGLEQGRAAAQSECEAERNALNGLLAYLAKPLAEQDDALEEELVALSMAIARQLVRRELQTAPGEIVPVVREALTVLPSAQRDITVTLHPEDATLVRQAVSDSAEADAWTLKEDPLLSRGGCLVQGGHSHVDASLESRLNAVAIGLVARSRSDD